MTNPSTVEVGGGLSPIDGPRWSASRPALHLPPLVRIVVRRLALAVPLLFVVSALSFVLVSVTPGDAARQILGASATPDRYAAVKHSLGLDRPLYDQYWTWARHAFHGDLGSSLFTGESVTHALGSRLAVTLSLITGALIVSVLAGVGLGVLSAVRGGVLGRAVDGFALTAFALPAFWVGAELIVLFAVKLHAFPATGYVPLAQSPSGWLRSLVLPVATLSLGGVAAIAKQTREAMLDVLSSEHIRVSWATGLAPASIYLRHALKNAAPPVITVLGVQAISLLGGTVLVESVFALPGLGSYAVESSLQHDLPIVQGIAVYFTVIVVIVNLVIDLAYNWLNPTVHTR